MDKSLLAWPSHSLISRTILRLSCIWSFSLLLMGSLQAQTNSSCGCQDQVNVQLDDNCQFVLTTQNVQSGVCTNVTIIVNDDLPSNGNIIDCAGLWDYGIFDDDNELICWGTVLAEDKKGPTVDENIRKIRRIECNYIDEILNNPNTINPNSKYYIGQVTFEDNCSSCGCEVNRKFYDDISYIDCNDNGVVARMTRTWTATDCEGNQTIETQTFNFIRPEIGDLTLVEDQVIQTCDTPAPSAVPQYYPYWIDAFGDKLYLNEVDCNYSVTVHEDRFDVCDGTSYKLERSIRVLDWCTGGSSEIDSYIVKVGDFEGPEFTGCAQEFTGNAFNYLKNRIDRDDFLDAYADDKLPTIRTVGNSCSASMFINQSSLENLLDFEIIDCGNVAISVSIYTYGPIIRFGFPQGPDIWQETNYPMINGIASGIPVGLHAVVIEANDNCKSSSSAFILFKVKDTTPPIMRCDDQLNISVTTGNPFISDLGAYARVDAIDVDEGTTDNCALDRLLVRRSVADLAACEASFIALGYDANGDDEIDEDDWFDENNNGIFDADSEFKWELVDGVWMSPWREYAEFFCCDVDQSVTIELRGWDKATDPLTGMAMPNFNTCWLDVLIEDDVDPVLSDLPDVTLNCDDLDLNLLVAGTYTNATTPDELAAIRARFGSVLVSGTECGATNITEVITSFVDSRCPEGYITREITASKTTDSKGTSTSTVTQTIFVSIKHDYYICFPADVTVDCDAGLPDVPGVTFSEGTCDLIAEQPPQDEVFTTGPAGPDNGCYKIFRTYRVINWCEYDGISPPVIVSRDWDGDNNTNPRRPDGDDAPGDEGICVIVKRDFLDNKPDTTYYDRDTDPNNNIPGNDDSVSPDTQGYWWRVISGSNDPDDPDYYDGPFDNNFNGTIGSNEESVWKNDKNDTGANDDNDFTYGSNGYWEYTQHIKVFDQTPPEITVTGADTFCSISNIDCAGDVLFTVSATDNCTPTEDLTFTVQLDVNNDDFDLIDVTSALVNGTFTARYPIGKHKLIFTVEDDCGAMKTSEEVEFTIEDCLAPSPICSSKLDVNLSPVEGDDIAALDIWASDFTNNSPVGDCTGQGPEMVEVNGVMRPQINKYSINRKGDSYDPDADGLTVTCADAGQLIPVEVHAIDEAGNHAFCNTFIDVQDNNNLCSAGITQAEIAGIISTPGGKMMEEVEVQLSGQMSMMYMTDINGEFSFKQLDVGHDYTVKPSKDIDHRNGVSIVDLLQIKKHVLNYEALDSPHRLIAADVDNSGSVTVKDMIEVQRMILHKIDKFEGNTSWRFIDQSYSFTNPENPFEKAFPELVNVNNLSKNNMATDFVAVKIGDPNGSAESLLPRSITQPLEVTTDDRSLLAGETYTFYLNADLNNFQGFQFTTALNQSVELVDVVPALLSKEQLGIFSSQGMITAAWSDLEPANNQNQALFGITIRAKQAVELSKVITINSRMTPAESVSELDKGTGTVILQVGNTNVSATEDFALFNNQPNPFNDFTNIRFQLPNAMQVNVQISDVSGRVIQTINQNFEAGEHQLQLTNKQFPAAGVYYLSMTAGDFTANQKLIFIR